MSLLVSLFDSLFVSLLVSDLVADFSAVVEFDVDPVSLFEAVAAVLVEEPVVALPPVFELATLSVL